MRTVTLPETVVSVGEYAFAENPGLLFVTLPASCQTIADNAFFNSPNVTLRCYFGSPSYDFAEENGLAFELRDSVLRGDADGNGRVGIYDVTAIQRHIAQLDLLNVLLQKAADVNADGKVDIADATEIQRCLAEFE